MAEIWPATLPTKMLVDSYEETLADNRLRSNMDRGPAKMRRLSTAGPRQIRGSMVMDDAQLADFRWFVDFILLGGTTTFWFPLQTAATGVALARIGEQMPSWSYLGESMWTVNMEIEVLP